MPPRDPVAETDEPCLPRDSHHLYLHVPFCRLVCGYCDFVTVGGRRDDMPRYVDGLLAELASRPAPGTLATIYLGGGTPSLLPAADVARLIDGALERWSARTAIAEVTIEANPGRRERPDWTALRAAGVTRVSLGAQALRDAELRTLARGHSVGEALAAYDGARAAGFDSVSLDLIYGIPGQSLADWRDGLTAALSLRPDHLSLYGLQLVLEPDEWAAAPRAGALRWRRRMAARQDEDVAAEQYRLAEELLAEAGYRHYELSSWARPGHESRHNLAYWLRRAYTGLGAGAHSYDGGALRSWNTRDLDGYLERIEAGRDPGAGSERLGEAERAFDAVALGLRLVGGLDRRRFAAEFGADPLDRYGGAVGDAVERGLLAVDRSRLKLTSRGRLVANEVLIGFLPA
jgi:oxygen-independent coproporphyrinogen-3 oxidase